MRRSGSCLGRMVRETRPLKATKVLHSDSSSHGWGVDVESGKLVQEYWREKSTLHINEKELAAPINTVQSLSKQGETVCLCVDNQVMYYYLTKGGGEEKLPSIKCCNPFSIGCWKRK